MGEFVASNGIRIWRNGSGGIDTLTPGGNPVVVLGSAYTLPVAEFFRAEEDERRGWWRWAGDELFVVYRWSIDYINVLYLHDGTSNEFRREVVDEGRSRSFVTDYERAARAWFDAHPKPEPWHEADYGDVWELDVVGTSKWVVLEAGDSDEPRPVFRDIRTMAQLPLDDPAIKGGRLLWTEPVA